MPRRAVLLCWGIGFLLALVGCAGERGTVRPAMLGPATMRLNPTFTRVQTGGVTADVELLDSFGDSVKGGGRLTFVLSEYRPQAGEVRGAAVGRPAQYDLDGRAAQEEHWVGVTDSYRFSLPWARLEARRAYVLEATYDAGGDAERQFDRLILRPAVR